MADTELLPTSRTNARGVTTAYTNDVHNVTETVATLTTSLTYASWATATSKPCHQSSDRNGQVSRFVYDARGTCCRRSMLLAGDHAHLALNGDRLSTQDPNGMSPAMPTTATAMSPPSPIPGVTRPTGCAQSPDHPHRCPGPHHHHRLRHPEPPGASTPVRYTPNTIRRQSCRRRQPGAPPPRL
jgi:hypothetical protein